MRPDSGIRTRMGPGLWDGSSLTPEAGIVLMRTDMPVPDGMKRMGSGTIWGSQMDACIRTAHQAIYNWVRGNIRYSGASATRDWVQEAYQGLRLRRGDCFTYYSVSQLLLSRAGIAGIEVVRSTDNHHYWNLVNIDGSWYHFDATPRRAGGYFFLWTDDQMEQYSRQHGGCFTFDRRLYPATPE